MRRRRQFQQPVDYLSRKGERRKLTNYLRTGNFKKIAGSSSVGGHALRRRVAFCAAAIVIAGIGLFFTVF